MVLGAGATGVVLQALHALTAPGDAIAMASPTFDGYPIIAQMARLNSLTVPLDKDGHNDLDGLADAAANARVVVVCRPHNPTGTLEPTAELMRFLRRVPRDTVVLLDEAYIEFAAPEHRIDVCGVGCAFSQRGGGADLLQGVRSGGAADRLRGGVARSWPQTLWSQQLPFGIAITSLLAVAASYNAEDELLQRIQLINAERRYLRMRLSALGIYTTDAHANFMYLPSRGGRGRPWHEVFADSWAPCAVLRGRRRADHRGQPRVDAGGAIGAGKGHASAPSAVRKGVAASRPQKRDPIAAARANWERAGWGDVSQGMVAVTSVMRAHQILLARVETALRPYDLSFSRYELLRLLAFSRTGALPITKASDRLQVHVTSVTHAIRRLEADGLVQRVPHPTDGRTTLVQITDLGRSTVEDATVTLNEQVFADIGMSDTESQALVSSIETLRRNAGDF